jgi:hypothetical protein
MILSFASYNREHWPIWSRGRLDIFFDCSFRAPLKFAQRAQRFSDSFSLLCTFIACSHFFCLQYNGVYISEPSTIVNTKNLQE